MAHLNAYSLEVNLQQVSLGEDGSLDWSTSDPVEDSCTEITFECPECHKVLLENKGSSTDPRIDALLK